MEVRIAVQHAIREIAFESNQTPEEISKAVNTAIKDGSLLSLTDDKGREILVPSDRIAFVEIGSAVERRVGFAG
jgi:predicted RNA-binding protein (virulence factor B family)